MKKRTWLATIAAAVFIGVPLVTLGPVKLAENGRAAASAASEPTQVTEPKPVPLVTPSGHSPAQRARWVCSDRISEIVNFPESLEWTRRSQWVTLETSPGVFDVMMRYTVQNRFGMRLSETKRCNVRVTDDVSQVVRVW